MKIHVVNGEKVDGETDVSCYRELQNMCLNRYMDEMIEAFDEHHDNNEPVEWLFGKEFTFSQKVKTMNPEGYDERLRDWIEYHAEVAWNTLDEYCYTEIGVVEMRRVEE